MKTTVYVDGFNLFYGALKGTPCKWLDLSALCRIVLQGQHDIQKIKYYTARVKSRAYNPDQALKQELYLRALRTLPNVEIIYGHFLETEVTVYREGKTPRFATGKKFEEKGSDVNLGVDLVDDAHRKQFEVAVLMTNDSDLLRPIQIVRRIGFPVGLINPFARSASKALARQATFLRSIKPSALKRSQFPNTMTDAKGEFYKPSDW